MSDTDEGWFTDPLTGEPRIHLAPKDDPLESEILTDAAVDPWWDDEDEVADILGADRPVTP